MATSNKFLLKLAYVGTNYQGWQKQLQSKDNLPSVQAKLEEACKKIFGEHFSLMGSGRTDSGVHGRRQHAHLRAETLLPPEVLLKALNAYLPLDIRVLDLVKCETDFHAQKSAKAKTYRYFIINNKTPHRHVNWPFLRSYTWFVSQPLDTRAMGRALSAIKGTHDFKAFQNRGTPVKSTVREILEAELIEHPSPSRQDFPWEPPAELGLVLLEIRLEGTGFLKQMVRNIVGNLVDVGLKKSTPEDFEKILLSKDRRKGGVTAPGRALFLDSVKY